MTFIFFNCFLKVELFQVPFLSLITGCCFLFLDLVMTNVGDDPANDLEISSDVSDASSRTEIVDPEIPNVVPLAISRPIANPVVLSDNSDSHDFFYQK